MLSRADFMSRKSCFLRNFLKLVPPSALILLFFVICSQSRTLVRTRSLGARSNDHLPCFFIQRYCCFLDAVENDSVNKLSYHCGRCASAATAVPIWWGKLHVDSGIVSFSVAKPVIGGVLSHSSLICDHLF